VALARSALSSSSDFNLTPQVTEASQEDLGQLGFVSPDKVAAAEAVVLDAIAKDEIGGGQHRGRDRDDRLRGPAAGFEAEELRL